MARALQPAREDCPQHTPLLRARPSSRAGWGARAGPGSGDPQRHPGWLPGRSSAPFPVDRDHALSLGQRLGLGWVVLMLCAVCLGLCSGDVEQEPSDGTGRPAGVGR